jgi:LacI family transcriptional regulator
VALSLKNNKTKTIGVIIPNILNRFLAKVLFGIEREASKHGYNIITCISNESLTKEKESLQLLANGSVDGFILSVAEETQIKNEVEHFRNTIKHGLPIVMFDRVAHDVLCDKVIVDDFDSTYNATKSLIEEGRKHIAFISNIHDLSVGKLREHGYNKAIIENANLKPLVLKIKKGDDHQKVIESLIKKNKNIDGIIAADTSSGIIAINTAVNLGLKVPEQVSIIGFASKSESDLTIPKLTTIRQHAKNIGALAAELLINRIQNSGLAEDVKTKIVKTSLVKNESTL